MEANVLFLSFRMYFQQSCVFSFKQVANIHPNALESLTFKSFCKSNWKCLNFTVVSLVFDASQLKAEAWVVQLLQWCGSDATCRLFQGRKKR